MPRVIDQELAAPCQLEEMREALTASGFDPHDEGSLLHAAGWLARLNGNRDFLAEIMLAELKDATGSQEAASDYGAQVVMLSPLGGEYFMRANFWPSRDEHSFRASGQRAFAYELPHDHNFDFLTVGYFGPGYVSDYYEYDYAAVAGLVGEQAGLRFVERSTLDPGKVMHYRAHLDVHSQLPPAALSVSINIMHAGGGQGWLDQYRFDPASDTVSGVLSAGASEIFLRTAVGLGHAEAHDLADSFARNHVSDRMRLVALEAQAGVLDLAARDALWRRAEGNGSRLIAGEATRRRRELAALSEACLGQ